MPSEPAALSFQRAADVRRELVRLGLADCPVWATAWGWNALPAGWSGQPSPWPVVDAERQAAYSVQALELARREWPWMGPMIVYTYQPDRRASRSATIRAGASAWWTRRASPGATWQHLVAYNTTPQPLHTGVYRAGPDTAQFEGAWRFSRAGAGRRRPAARRGRGRAQCDAHL